MKSEKKKNSAELSAVLTVIGVMILFSSAIIATLVIPTFSDPAWISPSSSYQKQMYEVSDPNLYISSSVQRGSDLQFVYHLKEGYTLLAFKESDTVKIIAPEPLRKYITPAGDGHLKLTSDLLLLRRPEKSDDFDAPAEAETRRKAEGDDKTARSNFVVYELYKPAGNDAFSLAPSDGILEDWVDQDFTILDENPRADYHRDYGVIYVRNPLEYRVERRKFRDDTIWRYSPGGDPISSIEELIGHELGFRSRKELIAYGEHIFAIEGCWYCHTDQTRTLIQDLVSNGSDSFPAPPSSANEYIYQRITFPGTKRNGPDLSRVGVKRPNRDWHKSHFWSPKTESRGSIMPAFQHFFDNDPRGTARGSTNIPNHKFEAIFQYLMTKGTRITPPTQAWWLGKDPVNIKEVIDGKRKVR